MDETRRECLRLNSGEVSHSYSLEMWPRCRCGLTEAPEAIQVMRPGGSQVIETKSLLMREHVQA